MKINKNLPRINPLVGIDLKASTEKLYTGELYKYNLKILYLYHYIKNKYDCCTSYLGDSIVITPKESNAQKIKDDFLMTAKRLFKDDNENIYYGVDKKTFHIQHHNENNYDNYSFIGNEVVEFDKQIKNNGRLSTYSSNGIIEGNYPQATPSITISQVDKEYVNIPLIIKFENDLVNTEVLHPFFKFQKKYTYNNIKHKGEHLQTLFIQNLGKSNQTYKKSYIQLNEDYYLNPFTAGYKIHGRFITASITFPLAKLHNIIEELNDLKVKFSNMNNKIKIYGDVSRLFKHTYIIDNGNTNHIFHTSEIYLASIQHKKGVEIDSLVNEDSAIEKRIFENDKIILLNMNI